MFIVKINKSVLITYLGVIFAVIAMYFSFTKIAFAEINYLRYSLVFLILSGICDMFDGKVARMCKRTIKEKEFGIQLDSLADTVNFLCLPVIIMLSLGMNTIIDIIVYCLFILCGVSRLGYFNVNANWTSCYFYFYYISFGRVTSWANFCECFSNCFNCCDIDYCNIVCNEDKNS